MKIVNICRSEDYQKCDERENHRISEQLPLIDGTKEVSYSLSIHFEPASRGSSQLRRILKYWEIHPVKQFSLNLLLILVESDFIRSLTLSEDIFSGS